MSEITSVEGDLELDWLPMFSKRTEWSLTTNRFTQALAHARAVGAEVLDLTVSNLTRADLHFDREAILGSLHASEVLDYDPQAKGLRSAREAVAAYYQADHKFTVDPESIVLTTSTSEGYSYVFRLLCNVGDEILVPKPSYPLFEFLADLQDVQLVPYPLLYDHGWQVDFPSVDKAVTPRTKAVVVVHPNNPTGSYASAHEIPLLNAFCREKGLALIVDEVFLDYPHDGVLRPSFARNDGVLTFTLSGLSKVSGLPQMKVAWVVTSGPETEKREALARLEVIADTYLSMNAPLQLATPTLLDQRKQIQPQLLNRVRANLQQFQKQLLRQQTCTALDVEGGWYAVLRVPVMQSDEDLAIELLRKTGVLVHPGHFYDFPADGYLVLSLITPAAIFDEGVRRVLAHLNA
jgi:alanine-synthesizing transaminase